MIGLFATHSFVDSELSCDAWGTGQWALRFHVYRRMCYNRMAVKQDGNQESASAGLRGAAVVESPSGNMAADKAGTGVQEDPSRYCPVCSQRLESRKCKLVCNVCGYYMSCADYY